MKNRDRNKPCACGSGKKIKKCCGTKSPVSHFEEETLWKGIVVHSQELTDA
ncbi:SEC-C metal-binding domain-containing protein, partial [Vibrio anguillarum]